jgi:hypothetical protein
MKRLTLNEETIRIKNIMGVLKEETEEDLRKILKDKFPSHTFRGKIERQGDNIVEKGFSKTRNSNFISTYKTSDDFFVTEIIDGPHKGLKLKRFEGRETEVIGKSDLYTKYQEKLKSYPCIDKMERSKIRESGNGKIVVGWENNGDGSAGGTIYVVLDDNTYYVRGGEIDGEQGKFSCDGKNIKWGEVTKAGTSKKVSRKSSATYFSDVTNSDPLKYGMRDSSIEPENGLIYQLQKKLKELNLYNAEPDGQFGPITYKAVVEFQKTGKDADGNPLVKDGIAGPKTIKALGLAD